MSGYHGDDRRGPQLDRRARAMDAVPYQVSLAGQALLEAILGDDTFELAEVGPLLARLAEFTSEGHPEPWTVERVLARVRELDDLYNPRHSVVVAG